MKKIVMIYDQIQSGQGIKDDHDVPLGIIKQPVGPAIMMEPYFKKQEMKVIACLYVGDGYYQNNESEVIRKMTLMIQKINPDGVICGPSFNYLVYSKMCAKLAQSISKLSIPVVCAMSEENKDVIMKYKDHISIVKTPKKGGIGLNESLEAITIVLNDNNQENKEKYCY